MGLWRKTDSDAHVRVVLLNKATSELAVSNSLYSFMHEPFIIDLVSYERGDIGLSDKVCTFEDIYLFHRVIYQK